MPAFPPLEIATKLLISLGIGLLVGFEREWAHKDLGVRTFAITSLFGMLAALVGGSFIAASWAGVFLLVALAEAGNLVQQRQLETTTTAALLVTFALGILVGQGHVFTPTASAIVMTLLLALKPELSRFAGVLTSEELRGAVLLGLIGFVIYPVLPDRFVDPWKLLNPREAWLTVILIASIGFANYVLLRLYGGKGIYYTAVLGGLVNSTAAVAELSGPLVAAGSAAATLAIILNLLTIVAMFGRNLILLALFSPRAGLIALAPIGVMTISALGFISWQSPRSIVHPNLKIGSPISLRRVAVFGAFFVIIQAAGSLGQRLLGQYGTVIVSALGGLVSSASSTAAVGSLAAHGQIGYFVAALSTVVASVASALVNLPILYRRGWDRRMMGRLLLISAAITCLGLATLGVMYFLGLDARSDQAPLGRASIGTNGGQRDLNVAYFHGF
jgi:uncharacterized membrane protein (DUF4010 family)